MSGVDAGNASPHATYSLSGKRVWVAGHRGMVGSALLRRLESEDCTVLSVSRDEVDLRDQSAVGSWMEQTRPNLVFLAAATVGGILANSERPANFLYDNLAIELSVLHAAHAIGVEKLVFLGSSCIYPKLADQPIKEAALLTGALEETNEAYAIAKIAGLKLAAAYRQQYGCDFISAMPTNLYGPNDNFDLRSSHVVPALIRKFHEAKMQDHGAVTIWGTGAPLREFLHVDDCADALVHLARTYSDREHVNVGTGRDITIRGLAELISDVVGFRGTLSFDTSKPDGTPRKLLSVDRLSATGWQAGISLRDGLTSTYDWFLQHTAD